MIQHIESCFTDINLKINHVNSQTPPITIQSNLFDLDIEKVIASSIIFIHSGDYVDFLKNQKIEDIITKLTTEIETTNNNLSVTNIIIQDELTTVFNKSKVLLEEIFEKCIVFFLNSVSELSKFQYTIIHRNFTFLTSKEERLNELFEYSNTFLLEYLLEESIEYYEHLGVLEKRINDFHQIKPFTKKNILRCKLTFLKYKWKKRQKYNRIFIKENVDINFSKKYIFANEEVDLSKKIKVGEEFYPVFEDWVKKIELHYFEGSDDIDEIYSSPQLISTTDNQLSNDFKLFFTIKFYKDIEKDFSKLESLKSTIKSSRLDKKNKLYYFNNLFSLLIKDGNRGEDTINNYFNEIKGYSNYSQSNNYFIYYKFLDYKLKLVRSKILQNKISTEELENYIRDCEILNNECNKKFEWTYRSFNILYQFDVTDCSIEFMGDNVYFPTSFLLPISITENKLLIANKVEDINDLKYKLIELKNNKYSETLKKQIKENEKKAVEMISLFTAVISFIMGSISGFKFIDNIYDAISFVTIFGLCLSIFLILILKLIRKDNTYNILEFLPIFIIFIILIFVCIQISTENIVSKENLHDELIKLNLLPKDSKPDSN
ncbi:hypothetical protein [Flavobacterium sp.]|uniref:hypothetical protein n=1 Tax=Flavobacterium sp. TaxID=239 RepID=UPI003D09E437